MKALISSITGGFSASAKVVDGTLILSLPDAIDPVVWRMELGHVRASAIEVRAQDNGTFMLTLKTPKGDINDIAPYDSRAKAVAALVAVSRAMEHAHGEIRPAANDGGRGEGGTVAQARKRFPGAQIVTGILGLALVIFLIGALMRLNPGPPQYGDMAGGDMAALRASGGGAAAPGALPAGEPISADDFLRSR